VSNLDPENRPKVSIEFELTGEKWDAVEDYNIHDSFVVDTDSWDITVFNDADPASLRRKFLPKTPIKLYYGNALQLIGRIDGTEGSGKSGKSLRVFGRDYIADILDASIDEAIVITNQMTLQDALLEALRPFGITAIETNSDEVIRKKMGPAKYNEIETEGPPTADGEPPPPVLVAVTEKVEEASPKKGANEGAWEWCKRLVARHGGTMQPGSSRSSVAVVVPNYQQKYYYFNRPGNMESGKARRDWSGIPTNAHLGGRYVTPGKGAKGAFKSLNIRGSDLPIYQIEECRRIIDAARTVEGRIARKKTGDPLDWYCPIYYRDDEAKSEKQLDKSARRMMAEQLRETLSYDVTVKGHVSPTTGGTYVTNVLADVQDEVEDVNEALWIIDRHLSFSGGEITQMHLIRPGSYVL
jgi:hypothetical protein